MSLLQSNKISGEGRVPVGSAVQIKLFRGARPIQKFTFIKPFLVAKNGRKSWRRCVKVDPPWSRWKERPDRMYAVYYTRAEKETRVERRIERKKWHHSPKSGGGDLDFIYNIQCAHEREKKRALTFLLPGISSGVSSLFCYRWDDALIFDIHTLTRILSLGGF
jgi:hypothetical protein